MAEDRKPINIFEPFVEFDQRLMLPNAFFQRCVALVGVIDLIYLLVDDLP